MTTTWDSDQPPPNLRLTFGGTLRVVLRGLLLALLVFGGLVILVLLRLVERPIFGLHRPVTPYITQTVCRAAFWVLGMRFVRHGTPMEGRGAVVANHTSWLDIFALNAAKRIYFVSKSEVAGWPGIGWLARATGTVFIRRDRAEARSQTEVFRARLMAGHKLLFFPEGTSTDGLQVLPFKTTLFEAFFDSELRDEIAVQPVSVIYHAPRGEDARFYGWWGDMSFGAHLLTTLAARKQGTVEVVYHSPLPVAAFAGRKALAQRCEAMVRAGHSARQTGVQ
ncbi:1-acyl-sn-glycerol-3-phosphate acyltransferase [Sulfitobacter sp. W027]|jgi:lyso-ornithine lipid O-acyltransferase|uniref:lysophospholipid acyltransferase family protein n=1 Tax=Sulfitobacter sp. W027 TaxID=2867025 RepID=UPI0021A95D28|nr:lysophospholipid acyltransferase family protein [Sulfitobacter sp. W027]UWR34980.1 1-acyl-sn-glycerol-3-phosphate acyltransferase [Sulfitobacter sp. W027]